MKHVNHDLVLAAGIDAKRVLTAVAASEWFSDRCHRPHPYLPRSHSYDHWDWEDC